MPQNQTRDNSASRPSLHHQHQLDSLCHNATHSTARHTTGNQTAEPRQHTAQQHGPVQKRNHSASPHPREASFTVPLHLCNTALILPVFTNHYSLSISLSPGNRPGGSLRLLTSPKVSTTPETELRMLELAMAGPLETVRKDG